MSKRSAARLKNEVGDEASIQMATLQGDIESLENEIDRARGVFSESVRDKLKELTVKRLKLQEGLKRWNRE